MERTLPRVEGVTMRLRRFLSSIELGKIFSTLEISHIGKRNAIDQALSRAKKAGKVQRVAAGLYCKSSWDIIQFTPFHVAQKKAQVFGKLIVRLLPGPQNYWESGDLSEDVYVFAVNGKSSSFKFGDKRITLKGMSSRKIQLAEGAAGRIVREYWQKGRAFCRELIAERFPDAMLKRVQRVERSTLYGLFQLMPHWLNDTLAAPRVREWRPPVPERPLVIIDTPESKQKREEALKQRRAAAAADLLAAVQQGGWSLSTIDDALH
jgi:hypothetical protein